MTSAQLSNYSKWSHVPLTNGSQKFQLILLFGKNALIGIKAFFYDALQYNY